MHIINRPISPKPPHFAGEKLNKYIPNKAAASAVENRCIELVTTSINNPSKNYSRAFIRSQLISQANTYSVDLAVGQAAFIMKEVLSDHFERQGTPANLIPKQIREIIRQDVLEKLSIPQEMLEKSPAISGLKREREAVNPFSDPHAKKPKTTQGNLVGLGINLGPSLPQEFYTYSHTTLDRNPGLTGNLCVSAYNQKKNVTRLTDKQKEVAATYHDQQRGAL